MKDVRELITITHTKPLLGILNLLRKWHVLQTPTVMQASQRLLPQQPAAGRRSARLQGEQALALTRIYFFTCHTGTCFSSRLRSCDCMHLPACWALGTGVCIHHYIHPARCTVNVLFIHWLPKGGKQLEQSFPNLDMEQACQTLDSQPGR